MGEVDGELAMPVVRMGEMGKVVDRSMPAKLSCEREPKSTGRELSECVQTQRWHSVRPAARHGVAERHCYSAR